jgi:CheY-like chemotaxis protein
MERVLIVDDDPGTQFGYRHILMRAGYNVNVVDTGAAAVLHVVHTTTDVVVADLRLPDFSGLEVLRQLRQKSVLLPAFVIVTAWSTVATAVDAIRLGAVDYVEKPLDNEALVQLVRRACAGLAQSDLCLVPNARAHAAARWAQAVIGVVDCPSDPRTLFDWGHHIGVSVGALRNWCRTAGLRPKRSLNFARVLRAVIRQPKEGKRAEDWLNVTDKRTLANLLTLGAPATTRKPSELPVSLEAFLEQQTWICEPSAVAEVKTQLQASSQCGKKALISRQSKD